MRLTSLALMFLFFFELASATISRRTMCLWNEVEMILNGRHDCSQSLVPRLLASSRFRPTNILVLSVLFTEHHFSLLSHAGNAFLIRFVFYQWLFMVVTHKKMRWDESTFVLISCSIFSRPGYLASKISSAWSWRCSWKLVRWHVLVKVLVLKLESTWRNWLNV